MHQAGVKEESEWIPELKFPDIGVAVKDGVVTLSGFVRSYDEKYEAAGAPKRVLGMRGVSIDLQVRLPGHGVRRGPDIAREAVAALRSRPLLPVDKIKVVVKEGWITPQGEVEWNYQREGAERAVRRLKGVRGVANMIVVRPTVPATIIRQKVELALKRHAGLDASRITVETQGSEVMGSVRSWAQYREVERFAWSAPGVSRVDNQLSVEP